MAELKLARLNKVLLSGRIASDIELRYTGKGTPVVKFTLAVDKSVKDESGQWQNKADFIDIQAWSKWAENVNNNAHKGSAIIVDGRLETQSYVDKDNNNRKAVFVTADYIQFLEYKPKDGEQTPQQQEQESVSTSQTNDDVPF